MALDTLIDLRDVVVSTIDREGNPASRIIDMMFREEDEVLQKIYEKNPSFGELFPADGETKNMEFFSIYKGKGELFDLSGERVKMQRVRFDSGGEEVSPAGCTITDVCINCGKCERVCPFEAISKKEHYEINRTYCDECGICNHVCPVDAIELPTGL